MSSYHLPNLLSTILTLRFIFLSYGIVLLLRHYPQPHSTPGTGRNNMTLILKRHSDGSNLVLLCCLSPSTFSHLCSICIERIQISLYRRLEKALQAITISLIASVIDYER